MMSAQVASAILVETREGLGIVSNADLRDKVVALGVSPDTPVSSIMTTPVVTVRGDQLATEAGIEMMRAGINHLVVVDARERVLGVISAASLMSTDAPARWSCARLLPRLTMWRRSLRRRSSCHRSSSHSSMRVSMHRAVSRIITLQSDSLTQRLAGTRHRTSRSAAYAFRLACPRQRRTR